MNKNKSYITNLIFSLSTRSKTIASIDDLTLDNERSTQKERLLLNALAILLGVLLLSALAQLSIRLPYTPVPITGQTFGVALMSLLWGRTRGALTFICYFVLGGVFNIPVFALGSAGLQMGPTMGYLVGMFLASIAMGTLADRGWTKSFAKTYLAAFIGSVITFSCGLFWLKNFVPQGALLISGLIPFLPGDFIKTLLASFIVTRLSNRQK